MLLLPSLFSPLRCCPQTERQQIERIKNELEPEFERCIELRVEESFLRVDKLNAGLDRRNEPGEEGRGKLQEQFLEAMKEVDDDPEWQKAFEELQSSTKAFAVLFKTRMIGILTDEQQKRLQDLIDNPPLHVRLNIQRGREMLGESTGTHEEGESKGADGKNVWVPGFDSWHPGDPVPVEYQREKNTGGNFPKAVE